MTAVATEIPAFSSIAVVHHEDVMRGMGAAMSTVGEAMAAGKLAALDIRFGSIEGVPDPAVPDQWIRAQAHTSGGLREDSLLVFAEGSAHELRAQYRSVAPLPARMRHEYLTADAGRLTRVSKQADGGVVVDHPEVPEALRGLAQVFTEGMITPRTNPDASALPALTAKEVREGCVMPTAEFAVALGRILYLTGEAIAGYEGHDPHGLHLQVGVDIRTLNDGSPSEQHRGPHRIEVHAVGADGLLSSDFHVEFRPVMGGGGVVDPAVVAVSAGLRFYGQARLAAAAQAQGERLAVGDSPFVHMARTALGPRDVLA